jgi:hypothetical protein
MVYIFDPACELNCCPHGRRNYTFVLLPLYCTFSLSLPPFPMYSMYLQTVCDLWGGGGGGFKIKMEQIKQEN